MVAKSQTEEILKVIEKWVPDRSTRAALLVDLTETKAYKKNTSFRFTINNLLNAFNAGRTGPMAPDWGSSLS